MPSKTRKLRKGPTASATLHHEGTIEWGNDKERWVVKNGRWVPYASATLHGYTPLTSKILAKYINKPLTVYEKDLYTYTWPKKNSDFDVKYTFTASGDATLKDKVYTNWLKKKTRSVKKNDMFLIDGVMKGFDSSIHVGTLPSELISSNLMNTDAFVKL